MSTADRPDLDPAPEPVTAMFDRQAARTPDLVAVEDGDRSTSYRQLAERSQALAAALVRRGVRAGDVVGVCVDRSTTLPLAILAILRTGAAYLPLDSGYPPDRLAFMVSDSGTRLVLIQPGRLSSVPLPPDVDLVDLDALSAPTPAAAATAAPISPHDLAYVMYTSGSTGRPKGVSMPHGPMTNLIAWQGRRSSSGPGARTLQFSAASFDASFQEMFSTWSTGGCLVLVDESTRRDPDRLLSFVGQRRIHRMFMPFVALQALAQAAERARVFPSDLCEVITAGEQLLVTPALRRFFQHCPGAVLVNQYGPSETHIVTSLPIGDDPLRWPEMPTVGWPIDGARIDVRAEDGSPLRTGEVGEICIGGDVLARGYLDRPALTAEKFVPDPFGPPGSRTYRSGDLGQLEPDGQVRWLRRADDQVKILGHRVELSEVEGALKALDDLRDGVVVVQDGPEGRRLIAYVLAHADVTATVRTRLRRTLPAYMLPAAVVALESFPFTPSGKVDRLGLSRRPVVVRGSAAGAAADDECAVLAGLWAEVLHGIDVGPDDNFFELGGTSLTGAVLLAQVNERFGAEVDLETLFANPTPARLSAWLRASQPVPQ